MKKNTLLFTFVLLLSANVFGQQAKGSFDALTLRLTALKANVVQMEPIPFKLELVNNTEIPVAGVGVSIDFASRSTKLEIKQPNGKIRTPGGLSSKISGMPLAHLVPREIAPGDKIETRDVYNSGHWNFLGKPGEYQIRASITNFDDKTVYSDWVKVTVSEPVSFEKAAYDYLMKRMNEHPPFAPFNNSTIDELEEFVAQYPGTIYADYFRYSLYQGYREKDKVKAENHLRAIQDKNFFYAKEISDDLKWLEGQKRY
jgi:hypothetical protein